MLSDTDITQNTYIRSRMVTEIKGREKCVHRVGPRTVCGQLTWSADMPYRWACMLQSDAVASQR
jgi:hypothetical protein